MNHSTGSALPRRSIALIMGASALAMASAVQAQTAPAASAQQPTQIDTVIVTASKRAEPVQKVPETVNVVSSSLISDLHIQDIIQLSDVVGGLALTMTSPSEQSISLRGIKEPSGGGPSTYTVESYLNQVPISVFDTFTSTLDLGQVEVLKGPQGTLWGRPAPSGAVTITTQKGSFTDYSGYGEATVSDHDGKRVEAAYGGPINDTLAFRLAGVYDYNGLTEVKDIYNGNSDFQQTGIVRGTLDWAPTDKFTTDVMAQYTHQNGDFYRQVEGVAPCAGGGGGAILVSSIACGRVLTLDDKIALNQGPNPNHYDGTIVTVNSRYALTKNIELDYVGGYNYNTYYTNLDFDFAGIGDANEFGKDIDVTTHRQTISDELRLQSNGNSFYNFIYGLFQENTRIDGVANLLRCLLIA